MIEYKMKKNNYYNTFDDIFNTLIKIKRTIINTNGLGLVI